MTVFHQPKAQWKTLLQQRSWSDLCAVDFVHIMERGSVERVKIFITSLMNKREQLEQHIPLLSACVNPDIFNNGKWSKPKIFKLLDFLLEHNRNSAPFDGQHQPYAPLIEAVVRHSDHKTFVHSHNKLLSLAVVRDSDLLDNLLQRMAPNERSKAAQQLFSDHKILINMSTPKIFFTRTTVDFLPEFPSMVVKHVCNNLREDIQIDLSISQRLKSTTINVLCKISGGNEHSYEDKMLYRHNRIQQFNQFVKLHENSLSAQHWKEILSLFKKITKKHDVSNADFLYSKNLKETLQKQIPENESQISSRPKRKM